MSRSHTSARPFAETIYGHDYECVVSSLLHVRFAKPWQDSLYLGLDFPPNLVISQSEPCPLIIRFGSTQRINHACYTYAGILHVCSFRLSIRGREITNKLDETVCDGVRDIRQKGYMQLLVVGVESVPGTIERQQQ
jgi:hypothetical protein